MRWTFLSCWLGLCLGTVAFADDPTTASNVAFSALDLNEDGVLSGREVRTVRGYDSDADGEVTRAEFLAGRRRETGTPAKDADPEKLFASKDLNEDDVLSGKEAKGFEQYDSDRDGEITLSEFLVGRAKDGKSASPQATPKAGTPAVSVSTDPRVQAYNENLATQLDQGKRWAIVVGINKYAGSPLRFCVSDARLVADTLVKQCGLPRDHVLVMTDDQTDSRLHPKKINLQALIPALLRKVGGKDTVLVYFAGHGVAAEGQSFLCPLDFDGASAKLTGWRVDELRTLLQDCAAGQKVLVIDCCHSGGAVTTSGFGATPQELGGAFKSAHGLITLASCGTNETSLESEELGHGVFTAALAGGLAGQADLDRNGIIDSDELYRHVWAEVPIAAQEVVPGHRQIPVRIIGQDVRGVFALARPDGQPTADSQPRLKPGDTVVNSIGMKLVMVPRGMFAMGSPSGEYLRSDTEVLAPIMMPRPIIVGAHEVTQRQYSKVMGANPSWFAAQGSGAADVKGLMTDDFPVEQVSWSDAVHFCEKLSKLPEEVQAGRRYRLPTEAEREYCCRAGSFTAFHTGELISNRQANIPGDQRNVKSSQGPSLGRTTKVGSYAPNGFGLYDMHGNVTEWCLDRLDSGRLIFDLEGSRPETADNVIGLIESFLAAEKSDRPLRFPANPRGELQGEMRILRGGSFMGDIALVRSAARREQNLTYVYKANGFRVVCELQK